MPTLCVGDKKLEVLQEGARVLAFPRGTWAERGGYVSLYIPDDERCWMPFAHGNCAHNQLVAVHNRVCGAVPNTKYQAYIRLKAHMRRLGDLLLRKNHGKFTPWPLEKMCESYTGLKRERYFQAARECNMTPYTRRESRCTAFVKFEKLPYLLSKPNPDPRVIQFRDPRYCVRLASYLKGLEHALYHLRGDGVVLPKSRVIGKGLSSRGRALLLRKKWDRFSHPVVVSLDASRFDKHVSRLLLKCEHSLYLRCCDAGQELKSLLRDQLRNDVRTRLGLRYSTSGNRMSGDMNTALGNCVLMVGMVSEIMNRKRIKYDLLDDGDDCLLIVEQSDLGKLGDLKDQFLEFGMEIKVEGTTDVFEDIDWCQTKPVLMADGWRMIRNPWKIMSNALTSPKFQTDSLLARRRLLASIGACELVVNRGCPVLQNYALMILRHGSGVPEFHDDDTRIRVGRDLQELNISLHEASSMPITDAARISFWRAFGVEPWEQVLWEEKFDRLALSIQGINRQMQYMDPAHWSQPHPYEASNRY